MATVDPVKNVRRRSTVGLWRDRATGEGRHAMRSKVRGQPLSRCDVFRSHSRNVSGRLRAAFWHIPLSANLRLDLPGHCDFPDVSPTFILIHTAAN